MTIVVVFLLLRAFTKTMGARVATAINGMTPVLGRGWGFGLLGQGGLAIAIALNYFYQDTLLLPDVVFTAAVMSVLLTDVAAGQFARSVVSPRTPANDAPVVDGPQPPDTEPPRSVPVVEHS
jgi:hypothetical protein